MTDYISTLFKIYGVAGEFLKFALVFGSYWLFMMLPWWGMVRLEEQKVQWATKRWVAAVFITAMVVLWFPMGLALLWTGLDFISGR